MAITKLTEACVIALSSVFATETDSHGNERKPAVRVTLTKRPDSQIEYLSDKLMTINVTAICDDQGRPYVTQRHRWDRLLR